MQICEQYFDFKTCFDEIGHLQRPDKVTDVWLTRNCGAQVNGWLFLCFEKLLELFGCHNVSGVAGD